MSFIAGTGAIAAPIVVSAGGALADKVTSLLTNFINNISPEYVDTFKDVIVWVGFIASGLYSALIVGILSFIVLSIIFIILLYRRNIQNNDSNPFWNALGYGLVLSILATMVIMTFTVVSAGTNYFVLIAGFIATLTLAGIIAYTGFSFVKDLPRNQTSGYAAFSIAFWPILAVTSIISIIMGYLSFKVGKKTVDVVSDLANVALVK